MTFCVHVSRLEAENGAAGTEVYLALSRKRMLMLIEDLQSILESSDPFEHEHYFEWDGDLTKGDVLEGGSDADHLKIVLVPDEPIVEAAR